MRFLFAIVFALVLSLALISCISCCFMNHEKKTKELIIMQTKLIRGIRPFLFYNIRRLIKNLSLHETRLIIRSLYLSL